MFKIMRLVILFDMFLNPSFKMTTSFANVARTAASTSNNTISLSRHEQVCLMRLRFERYFSHHRAMMGEVSLET